MNRPDYGARMGIELKKDAIDLGICVSDIEASLGFYRDLLGLPYERSMPAGGGNTIHFLSCGSTNIKLWEVAKPPAPAFRGGFHEMAGYRYLTITVGNLDEVVAEAERAGVKLMVPITELGPGIRIAILNDPDGNPVELLAG
jgi:catechol 2,3-dioxygenase-like lactoylglutathione lyase family enzyme